MGIANIKNFSISILNKLILELPSINKSASLATVKLLYPSFLPFAFQSSSTASRKQSINRTLHKRGTVRVIIYAAETMTHRLIYDVMLRYIL